MKRSPVIITIALIILSIAAQTAFSQELAVIELPAPDKTGGKPLMQALAERKTTRSYSQRELSNETLSNLLWAAFGINRSDGRRTAPSAMNWQEIDIYVAMKKGCYRYDPQNHRLVPVLAKDIRVETGQQPFVGTAPVNLIYVADLKRMGNADEEALLRTANADTGFIGQNVYLFCASEGLATVVRGLVDRDALAKTLNLAPNQKVTLAQTVGYPGQ